MISYIVGGIAGYFMAGGSRGGYAIGRARYLAILSMGSTAYALGLQLTPHLDANLAQLHSLVLLAMTGLFLGFAITMRCRDIGSGGWTAAFAFIIPMASLWLALFRGTGRYAQVAKIPYIDGFGGIVIAILVAMTGLGAVSSLASSDGQMNVEIRLDNRP